jgi:hypothetical protein
MWIGGGGVKNSSTHSHLRLKLVSNKHHEPAALTLGKTSGTNRIASPGDSTVGLDDLLKRQISCHAGIRTRDRYPASSESLNRLSYAASHIIFYKSDLVTKLLAKISETDSTCFISVTFEQVVTTHIWSASFPSDV